MKMTILLFLLQTVPKYVMNIMGMGCACGMIAHIVKQQSSFGML